MDSLPSGLSALLWFALVVAAIPLALWLLKRTPLGGAGLQAGPVRTVATLPLGPGQRLLTVEVGHGEQRRWLLLGVTAQQITTLHEMAPSSSAPQAGAAEAPAFAQMLASWRSRSGGPREG